MAKIWEMYDNKMIKFILESISKKENIMMSDILIGNLSLDDYFNDYEINECINYFIEKDILKCENHILIYNS